MGSLRLAFLKTHYVTKGPNDIGKEDHVVMEMDQGQLLDEFKEYLNRHLGEHKSFTKQDIWAALDHAAVDLVSDYRKQSVRIF
jgi:predicted RNA-binding Zn ribbon-like protein